MNILDDLYLKRAILMDKLYKIEKEIETYNEYTTLYVTKFIEEEGIIKLFEIKAVKKNNYYDYQNDVFIQFNELDKIIDNQIVSLTGYHEDKLKKEFKDNIEYYTRILNKLNSC